GKRGLPAGVNAVRRVRVAVAAQQRRLKEQHARAPDRRTPAKPRQDHLGDHRLNLEQQKSGEKDRKREQRHSWSQLLRYRHLHYGSKCFALGVPDRVMVVHKFSDTMPFPCSLRNPFAASSPPSSLRCLALTNSTFEASRS